MEKLAESDCSIETTVIKPELYEKLIGCIAVENSNIILFIN